MWYFTIGFLTKMRCQMCIRDSCLPLSTLLLQPHPSPYLVIDSSSEPSPLDKRQMPSNDTRHRKVIFVHNSVLSPWNLTRKTQKSLSHLFRDSYTQACMDALLTIVIVVTGTKVLSITGSNRHHKASDNRTLDGRYLPSEPVI